MMKFVHDENVMDNGLGTSSMKKYLELYKIYTYYCFVENNECERST